LLVIALAAAAVAGCSQGSATDTTVKTGPTVTSAPGTTGAPDASTSTTATQGGATTTISDRPLAPDFTLELGDGGSYTLSDGAKPVYLVFWAEW
jgi:hypothetical protein